MTLHPIVSMTTAERNNKRRRVLIVQKFTNILQVFVSLFVSRGTAPPGPGNQATVTNHSLQQKVGSSYWSVLNFFGPADLLETKIKRVSVSFKESFQSRTRAEQLCMSHSL